MNKAIDIAKIIIDCLKADGEYTVSNMAVNKLLYFAQAHCLARLGRPLFEDHIEAWTNGPIVPAVYHAYKRFGSLPIILTETVQDDLIADDVELLTDVLREYGKYGAKHLSFLSHAVGSPWYANYDASSEFHSNEITPNEMAEYFSKKEVLPKYVMPSHVQIVSVLPKEWYDPAEDAEWEDCKR